MATTSEPFLEQFARTQRFMSGRPGSITFPGDGRTLLFLRGEATSAVQSLYELELATGSVRELLTAETLLQGASQELSVEEKARLERLRSAARGITGYTLSPDGRLIVTSVSGRLYLFDRQTGQTRQLETGEGAPLDPRFSPDGARIAYVRGRELCVFDLASGQERVLTKGARGEVTHGLADFIAQEEMHRYSGFWWSPDGNAIAFQRTDASDVEAFAIVDPTHPERGATTFRYPRPGRNNADVQLGVVGIEGGEPIWVHWDRMRYPYLARVTWSKNAPLTVLVQNRHQTEELLFAVDGTTGSTHTLLEERDDAWLNLDAALPRWLPDGSGFFWFTERNGGPEVELRGRDGAHVRTLVPKELGYASYVGWDRRTESLYFLGSPDAPEVLLWRVGKDGAPTRLAWGLDGPGMQDAVLASNGEHVVLFSTTLRSMRKAELWRTDGTRVVEIPSVAAEPPFVPTTEVRKVGDYWTAIVRPRDFQPGRRYPVVLQVYGGPHHLEVKHSMREELLLQWLADHGFIVVKADNRGTTHRRGRAWERAIKCDLGGVPMDDQVEALKALAAELPELDLSRVGISGWSYGGYMAALGMLRYPEVFKVGIAGAPVVDWRDYDTHYTERYMGLPQENAEAYEKASLLSWAERLEGSLLLIHGTADDNVYFFHTLKLSDALFRAGKVHDVLPLSDFTHMVADPNVTVRLQQRVLKQLVDVLRPSSEI